MTTYSGGAFRSDDDEVDGQAPLLLDPKSKRFSVKHIPCETEDCTCKAVIRVGEVWHNSELEVETHPTRFFESSRPAEGDELSNAKKERNDRKFPFRSSAQLGDPNPDGCCGQVPKREHGCSYEDCLFRIVPLRVRVKGGPPRTFGPLKQVAGDVSPNKHWLHKLEVRYSYICGKSWDGGDFVNWKASESAYVWLGDDDYSPIPVKSAFNSSPKRESRGLPTEKILEPFRRLDKNANVYFSVGCGCTLSVEFHLWRIPPNPNNLPDAGPPGLVDMLPYVLPGFGKPGEVAAGIVDAAGEILSLIYI